MSKLQTFIFYPIVLLISLQQYKCETRECVPRKFDAGSFVCVCNATYCDSIEPLPEKWDTNQYVAYTSTSGGLRMKQTIGTLETVEGEVTADFTISRETTYQTIMGFGGSMTDASGVNIASLPEETQDILMKQYFGEEGIQYTIVRVPVGGSDFSIRPYSYDDTSNDLTNFSLAEEDFKYKIPYLKQAIRLSKQYPIKLMGCPWSPPAFMKTNQKLKGGGELLPEFYQLYAEYLIMFLQAYKEQGLEFYILSTQNEPKVGNSKAYYFNGMGWSGETQATFIAENLYETLEATGFGDVKILIGDDQRFYMYGWVKDVLKNKKAAKYFSGLGIHWYLDHISPPEIITDIRNLPGFEDKFILYTEACEGAQIEIRQRGVRLGSWKSGTRYLSNIIENLNHWAEGWVDWNIALDLEGGPNWARNFVDSPIIVNATSGEFLKNPMYYALAHVSKFLVPGSKRIQLENKNKHLKGTVFSTPDNHTVIVLINDRKQDYNLTIHDLDLNIFTNVNVPASSFITYIY